MTLLEDNVLGTLTYESEYGWFTGFADFGGKRAEIRVTLKVPPDKVSESEIVGARQAYLALLERRDTIEAEIVRECLSLYNDVWRDGDMISREQFLDVLEIESVDIEDGHAKTIWYTAGDLFTDHAIEVRFNDDGSISETALAG